MDIPPAKFTARINKWHQGDIIRNIQTSKPYLIVHVFIDTGVMVYDLEANEELIIPILLKPCNYDKYCKDEEFELRKNGEDWKLKYNPINI